MDFMIPMLYGIVHGSDRQHCWAVDWGIGVSAGAALTRQGVQPYIGIGVQYNLISF